MSGWLHRSAIGGQHADRRLEILYDLRVHRGDGISLWPVGRADPGSDHRNRAKCAHQDKIAPCPDKKSLCRRSILCRLVAGHLLIIIRYVIALIDRGPGGAPDAVCQRTVPGASIQLVETKLVALTQLRVGG